jgi:hypothetical protein
MIFKVIHGMRTFLLVFAIAIFGFADAFISISKEKEKSPEIPSD